MKLKKKTGIFIIFAQFFVYAFFYWWFGFNQNPVIQILWTIQNVLTILGLYYLTFMPSVKDQSLPKGRIVAVIASYNETKESIEKTVNSLLSQSVEIDEIHVIDDGSINRMDEFKHPRVVCHWQENAGKRHAQATVLRSLDPDTVDFILTVDSDSVLEYDATEMLLRSMSNDKVKACTGSLFASNCDKSFLTKLQEFNYGLGAAIKASRRINGALDSTSGACSMYRAEIVFFHLDDYLDSGTNGDDRRLCIYSLLEGDVIYVPEAVVHTEVPEKFGELWRQRIRWGKSGWQALPVVLANFPIKKQIFVFLTFMMWVAFPVLFVFLIDCLIRNPFLLPFWSIFYVCNSYVRTLFYVTTRPNWSKSKKFKTWLFYSPFITPFYLFLFLVKYFALTRLKVRGWETRS